MFYIVDMKYLYLLLLTALIGCSSFDKDVDSNQLLLVSFDGFRVDYLSKTDTPNFDYLIENGVVSEGLIPVFPTKTFPNYYAIATGLYPENNGIIGNSMYDPDLDAKYSLGNREAVENPDWYLGEPIWNTVEKAGKKAGTMFWVGSEAPIQNMRPTHWKSYDGNMPKEARIDSVLKWMTDSTSPVDLGTLYYSFVDSEGHRHGPNSPEVISAIEKADSLVGYLMKELTRLDPENKINILLVSDHGMTELSPNRKVVLDNYINTDDIEIISGSPTVMFNVTKGKEESIYNSLKANEEHFLIYKKEDIPDRFNLKNNKRVPEFLMIAEDGYTINTQSYFDRRGENYPSGGAHGFDNENKKMDALFIAHGKVFKNNYKIGRVENIHLYALMANILNITPAKTDGDIEKIKEILQ